MRSSPDLDEADMDSSCSSNHDDQLEARDEVAEVRRLSHNETRRVRIMRMVIAALLVAAVAVTLVTFQLLRDEQTKAFEAAFAQFSRTLADAAKSHRMDITQAYKALSEAVAAGQITSSAEWPYYTLPFFENFAKTFMDQGGVELASVAIKVTQEQVEPWLKYANETYKIWVDEGHMYQYGNLDNLDPVNYKPYITAAVPGKGLLPENTSKPEFWVHWSSYPAPATYGLMNWNFASVPDYANIIKALHVLKNETVVTTVRSYAALIGTAFTKEYHDSLHGPIPEGEVEYPHSSHMHAILDRLNDDENAEVVGFISGGVAWDHAMKNLLPEGVSHITAVIQNNCNQSYTFDIDGPGANFVGTGDLHETAYDRYKVTADLNVHKHPLSAQTPGHCFFWLDLYPTQRFENAYNTNTPEVFAIVVACTFVMIAVALYCYHVLVEKRNSKLVKTTAKSQGIVAQLFPDQVRDQLMAEQEDKQETAPGSNKPTVEDKASKLMNLMHTSSDDSSDEYVAQQKKIIADYFEESTVLFADMAGFTSWSSSREPQEVFLLLETLYAAFDKAAKRRGVYKVETIGDCYVAVTGVPSYRKDHALAMVKFAREIMITMSVETKKLEDALGPETGNLMLRAGIHSGPVTAGVLRGDRARFQLFGDTMNTASRMESTGVPGRIHLSKETAELLCNHGKDSWIEERPEGVEAKGKGNMKTFFLVFGNDHTVETNTISDPSHGSGEVERY